MKAGDIALVVGGSGGIGRAICRELAATGHRVAVADISGAQAEEVAGRIGGLPVVLDITDPISVSQTIGSLVTENGPVSVCVHAAGWDEFRPFVETDEEFSRKVIEINYSGVVRVTRAVLPGMIEKGWGRIVTIASDAGRVGSSMEAVYSGAKGGVIAFTKSVAREVAKSGITVNAVCPGPTETPMLMRAAETMEDGERFIQRLSRAVPMRRLGQPDDVAPLISFLVSEGAGYMTGQTVSVSGGLTMA